MDKTKLTAMTVKDLRAEAEKLGIKKTSTLKKNELIDAIIAANAANEKSSKTTKTAKSDAAKSDKSAEAKKDAKTSAKAKSDTAKEASPKAAKAVKTGKAIDKKADDKIADDDALEAKKATDAESEEDDEQSAKKDAKLDAEKVEEPVPVEPDSIFIDHGAILPEFVPGTCLYALVRDPGTLFVYWNATFESANGWLLTAYDHSGNILQSFTTPARRNGRGYFRIPTARVARVTLSIITSSGNSELKLESKIRIAEQLGIAQPRPAFDERWVDVQNRKVIYEAPAPGRAPQFAEAYQAMDAPALTGGGFDRAVENQRIWDPTSSRFGLLNPGAPAAPGSSDKLVRPGSSDSFIGSSHNGRR